MATTLKSVRVTNVSKDIFFEGNLVQLKGTEDVYLVTVPAAGYSQIQPEGTFWAIYLGGSFTSGGSYLKDLFEQFVGKITLEGKY